MEDVIYLPINDPTQVGQARREISDLGRSLGLNETEVGKVAIVVTEMASNLIKHAGGGEMIARGLDGGPGIEILALDQGPGISDAAASVRDGFSTAGTPGTGLGAIARLSTDFDLYSLPGSGTALMARIQRPPARGSSAPLPMDIGAVSVPNVGEQVCGDGWAAIQNDGCVGLLLADGLGHGISAADAAREAIAVFSDNPGLGPSDVLQLVHGALKKTRGAAVAIAVVDLGRRIVDYAGLGNISGVIANPAGRRSLISHNGTAGHEARKFQQFTYPWTEDSILIMHSDGLVSHWDLERFPGLISRRASLIAGRLYSDFSRRRDDVTVVVARENRA